VTNYILDRESDPPSVREEPDMGSFAISVIGVIVDKGKQ